MGTEDNGWQSYDDLIDEGEADQRVGDHIAIIDELIVDRWPQSGDQRYRAIVRLQTAYDARADFTMTARKSKDETRKEIQAAPPKTRKAIAANLKLHEELHKFYGKTVADLVKGMKLGVKTVKTKRDPVTGKGGFIRVIAFKPMDEVNKGDEKRSEVPF